MSVDKEITKAYELWSSFKEEVLYENRYIVNHEVLDYLKHFSERNQKTIDYETILYRARLYTEDETFIQYLGSNFNDEGLDNTDRLMMAYRKHQINSRHESGFWGYDEKGSFVPSNNDFVNDGRANPVYIKYLYTAEEPYTALVEVRPYLNSKVSVAKIKVNESLVIADFSYESFGNFEGFEQNLIYFIMRDFTNPSNSDKKSYIPTQYVAEFMKTLGIEGIRFNSSLHGRGRNITIFNYDKCQAVGSKLYQIEDICFEAKGIAPINEKKLIHEKLKPYKKKQLNESIEGLINISEKKEN
jgi:hypothetical protein